MVKEEANQAFTLGLTLGCGVGKHYLGTRYYLQVKEKKTTGKHESVKNVTPWFSSIIKLPGNKTVHSSVVLSLVFSGIKR